VAKADNSHTPETWNTLQAVYPLVLKICISPSEAGLWLAGLIFTTRQVRARWLGVRPASTSAEIFFSPDTLPTLNFSDNSAETWEAPSVESGVVGICPVIMLGIEVVREDIAAQRPGVEAELAQSQQSTAMHVDHLGIANVTLPPSFMSRMEALLMWLGSWLRPGSTAPSGTQSDDPARVDPPCRRVRVRS